MPCRTFVVPVFDNDLLDQLLLINEATLRDKDIAESEVCDIVIP